MPHHNPAFKITTGANALVGIWIFLSPSIFGAWTAPDAWNSWVMGAFVTIAATVRFLMPIGSRFLSWINMVLGLWVLLSPWIFGYDGARALNSICAGVVVVALSICGLALRPVRGGPEDRHLRRV